VRFGTIAPPLCSLHLTTLHILCLYQKIVNRLLVSSSGSLARSGAWTGGGGMWVELSGKMHVLARLLGHLRQRTDDRIVLVSNYTQVIDQLL
jgi:hypothetical protein